MYAIPLILVVDDEQVNRMVLRATLIEAGFQVATASDGLQAREMAQDLQPDLIILDIMMPGESGFETCDRLLETPSTCDIPIIFLSGRADVDDKVRGLETGAVDYVTKPFAGGEVVARVKTHLRLRRANHALIAQQAAKLSQIREAQQAILVSPAELPEARFAVRYLPAHEAGGDFYDVFPVSAKGFGYFVADVSGHDLGASFITSSLKALIRQNAGPLDGPSDALRTMNGVLRTLLAPGQHLSAAYLTLARPSGRIRLALAGHPAPLLVTAQGETFFLETDGDLLGAFANVHFKVLDMRAQPGDRIYMYTDGLIERPGFSREKGMSALAARCAKSCGLPLEQAVASVVEGITPLGRPPEDDVVLLGIEV